MVCAAVTSKTCTKCGEVKALEEFGRNRGLVGGYSYCKPCNRAAAQVWRKANPKRRGELDAAGGQALYIYRAAKWRAKAQGVTFTLKLCDIVIPEFCPVLGIKLTWAIGCGGRTDSSASLDKIIPELGYIPGNVRIISWRANSLKKDGTIEELEKVLAYMRQGAQVNLPL